MAFRAIGVFMGAPRAKSSEVWFDGSSAFKVEEADFGFRGVGVWKTLELERLPALPFTWMGRFTYN